jgi:hypothetical protein
MAKPAKLRFSAVFCGNLMYTGGHGEEYSRVIDTITATLIAAKAPGNPDLVLETWTPSHATRAWDGQKWISTSSVKLVRPVTRR